MTKTNITTDDIINFEALWDSHLKCQKGVGWKPSVKHFRLNAIEEIVKMTNQLKDGTWKNGKPKPILITFPKRREGLSVSYRDRVYQRSINDNALYPIMSRSFIKDNAACQKNKGTDFARSRLKKMLWNHYFHNGNNGFAGQIDITGYYQNMRHNEVETTFSRKMPYGIFEMTRGVLNNQYTGDVGYNPGSQMVQIAAISVLSDLDHYIKERLHVKHYIRYMDDFIFIHKDKEFLENAIQEVKIYLSKMGFSISKKKTKITRISNKFRFLGFYYRVTNTGKVVMSIDPENVKHERRKLTRMVKLAKKGKLTKEKVDECYFSWKNHANKGNSYKLLKRMDEFYNNLWRK